MTAAKGKIHCPNPTCRALLSYYIHLLLPQEEGDRVRRMPHYVTHSDPWGANVITSCRECGVELTFAWRLMKEEGRNRPSRLPRPPPIPPPPTAMAVRVAAQAAAQPPPAPPSTPSAATAPLRAGSGMKKVEEAVAEAFAELNASSKKENGATPSSVKAPPRPGDADSGWPVEGRPGIVYEEPHGALTQFAIEQWDLEE